MNTTTSPHPQPIGLTRRCRRHIESLAPDQTAPFLRLTTPAPTDEALQAV